LSLLLMGVLGVRMTQNFTLPLSLLRWMVQKLQTLCRAQSPSKAGVSPSDMMLMAIRTRMATLIQSFIEVDLTPPRQPHRPSIKDFSVVEDPFRVTGNKSPPPTKARDKDVQSGGANNRDELAAEQQKQVRCFGDCFDIQTHKCDSSAPDYTRSPVETSTTAPPREEIGHRASSDSHHQKEEPPPFKDSGMAGTSKLSNPPEVEQLPDTLTPTLEVVQTEA